MAVYKINDYYRMAFLLSPIFLRKTKNPLKSRVSFVKQIKTEVKTIYKITAHFYPNLHYFLSQLSSADTLVVIFVFLLYRLINRHLLFVVNIHPLILVAVFS